MDGQPVTTGEPSDIGIQTDPDTGIYIGATSFTEIFMEAFPQYLSMGMSYDEFWNYDPSLVKAYRKAWEMKVSQRNWEMWMQGGYIYDALLKVAPVMASGGMGGKGKVEPGKYPDRPYPLTEKEVKAQEDLSCIDPLINVQIIYLSIYSVPEPCGPDGLVVGCHL